MFKARLTDEKLGSATLILVIMSQFCVKKMKTMKRYRCFTYKNKYTCLACICLA